VELVTHPFFVGTLFIPQYSSTAAMPHPLIGGFARAAEARALRHPNTASAASSAND
jgi:CTP synthase (UTP-ammonia lyase)